MIITQEFLTAAEICKDGQKVCDEGNYIGWEYDEALKDLLRRGLKDDAGWMIKVKETELYVRSNGSIFHMEYVVYDPINGQNVRAKSIEEAKLLSIEVAEKILQHHMPQVGKILINENGDETYLGLDPTIIKPLTAVEK
jgi:hypothetical protein